MINYQDFSIRIKHQAKVSLRWRNFYRQFVGRKLQASHEVEAIKAPFATLSNKSKAALPRTKPYLAMDGAPTFAWNPFLATDRKAIYVYERTLARPV